MREIVSFFIGQAGVQSGMAIWELFCVEHSIGTDGYRLDNDIEQYGINTFFQKTSINTFVPRALFVDLEPTVVDEIRSGSFCRLFHPDRLLTGPEDASNNFSRGFFTVGKLLLGSITTQIRHLVEQSDMVMGMMLLRSLGGGTGAGLTSAMFEILSEYPKTPKVEVPIYPSPFLSTSMVEPYNCLLGEHFCMEDIDVGLLLDNEAMFDMCSRFLNVQYPTYYTINRLISQIASSITASVRFENVLNCDLSVLQTNLVPYPRIHFPLCNFAPILSYDRALHQSLSAQELTRMVFDRQNQMMKIDHFYGRFMSCALFYRGNVCPHHVYSALSEIKRDKSIEFVDWCPTGFKIGINVMQPVMIPENLFANTRKNVAMLTNTSAVGQAWQRLAHRFYLLYSKRSFIHWFVGEGMEECEFTEALYNISSLVKDYEEAAESNNTGEGEDGGEGAVNVAKRSASNNYNNTQNAIINNQNNCSTPQCNINKSLTQQKPHNNNVIDSSSSSNNDSNCPIEKSQTLHTNNSKCVTDSMSDTNNSDVFSNNTSLVEDLTPVKSLVVGDTGGNTQLNRNISNSTNHNQINSSSKINDQHHADCKLTYHNNHNCVKDAIVVNAVNFESSKVFHNPLDTFSNSSSNYHERSLSATSKMSFLSNKQSTDSSSTPTYQRSRTQSTKKAYSIKHISIENKLDRLFNSHQSSSDDNSPKPLITAPKDNSKEQKTDNSNTPSNVGLKPKKRHLRWVISKDSKNIQKFDNDINQRLCNMIYNKSSSLLSGLDDKSATKNDVQSINKQSQKDEDNNTSFNSETLQNLSIKNFDTNIDTSSEYSKIS